MVRRPASPGALAAITGLGTRPRWRSTRSGGLDEDLEGVAGRHQGQGLRHLVERHAVGDEAVGHEASRDSSRSTARRIEVGRVVERAHQRQLLVVGAARVDRDRGAGRAAAEEHDGAAPRPTRVDGLLPDLGPAGGVDRDVGAPAAREPAQRAATTSGPARGVHALRDAERADALETPARLPHDEHAGSAGRATMASRQPERAVAEHRHGHARLDAARSTPRSAQASGSAKAARDAGSAGADGHDVLAAPAGRAARCTRRTPRSRRGGPRTGWVGPPAHERAAPGRAPSWRRPRGRPRGSRATPAPVAADHAGELVAERRWAHAGSSRGGRGAAS